jgi:penicillin-binding protein 1A
LRFLFRTALRFCFYTGIFVVVGSVMWNWMTVVARIDVAEFEAALNRPTMLVRLHDEQVLAINCNCARTLRRDEISDLVAASVVAIEDRRFYSHFGLDPKGIARAISTGLSEGGSTLTQQLAKTAFTGDYRTLRRKLVEGLFALRIEATHTKSEILRLYLSRVHFGNAAGAAVYGLRDAAGVYFGKSPKNLNAAEIALLIGMLKAPSDYDLLREPQAATERGQTVLGVLRNAGLTNISDSSIASALPNAPRRSVTRRRYIEDQLVDEFAEQSKGLPNGWYRLVSSIDPIAQFRAEHAISSEFSKMTGRRVTRAALMSIDPQGRILAMVGDRDYATSKWNIALKGRRQAASTAKIATYLAALEAGWKHSDTVWDDQSRLKSKFVPRNSDGKYIGKTDLATCFKQSRNVCTVYLAEQVGMDKVSEMAARIGLTETKVAGSSVVLGAAETTLIKNTAAYAAISGNGRIPSPRALRLVLGPYGEQVFDDPPKLSQPILPASVLAGMRELLRLATMEGTGRNARFIGSNAFGKTGTSQENRDAWFIGFTGDGMTTGVWVGPDEGKTMKNVAGGGLPAKIFARFNRNLVERFYAHVNALPLPR